jgi:hypothetical protein
MRVSAIIATYNRDRYLRQSLESVLGQTRPPDEVIVVNDGSDDGTAAILQDYRDRIMVLDQANGGKASALNRAIPQTTGDLIWIFDDDDIAFPDALARHTAVHARNPQIGFSYSPKVTLHTDTTGAERAGELVPIIDMAPDTIFYHMQSGCKFSQQGSVVHRTCFDDVGFFDETLHRAQDYDFLLRLSRRHRGMRLDMPTYFFREHADLRGSKSIPHTQDDRLTMFFQYEHRIWAKLLPTMSVDECLPAPAEPDADGALRHRQAAVRRMMIAGRNGLLETLLAEAAALPVGPGPRLTDAERHSARLTFARRPAAVHAMRAGGVVDALCERLRAKRCYELMLFYALGLRTAARALDHHERGAADAALLRQRMRQFLSAGGWRRLPSYLRKKVHAA